MNEQEIRFELIKICSRNDYPTNGVGEILFDAKKLYNFVKDGAMPQIETKESD